MTRAPLQAVQALVARRSPCRSATTGGEHAAARRARACRAPRTCRGSRRRTRRRSGSSDRVVAVVAQADPLVEPVLPEEPRALDVQHALAASTGPPIGGSGRLVSVGGEEARCPGRSPPLSSDGGSPADAAGGSATGCGCRRGTGRRRRPRCRRSASATTKVSPSLSANSRCGTRGSPVSPCSTAASAPAPDRPCRPQRVRGAPSAAGRCAPARARQ